MTKLITLIFLSVGFLKTQAYTKEPIDLALDKSISNKIIVVNFRNYFGKELVSLDSVYYFGNQHSISFRNVKYYISAIQLFSNNNLVFSDQNYTYLIDAANPQSQQIRLEVPNGIVFDQIAFSIGVDSAHNELGAMSGDLDPYKGMYWTWQSGYINVKLEGKFTSTDLSNDDFQYHIGGYQYPNNAMQAVSLTLSGGYNYNTIDIGIDLQDFFDNINPIQSTHIMSPSSLAVSFAKKFASFFKIISL